MVRAEVEHHTKTPFDIVEALDQSIGDLPMQKLNAAAACRTIAVPPPGAAIEQHQWEVVGSGHRGENLRVWVDESARYLMMCIDARLGNSCQLGFQPFAADRQSRRRRSVAAALSRMRRNDWRARCSVRPVLGKHYVFCTAVVRRLRRAVCLSDG
jgi:hypothetical protein